MALVNAGAMIWNQAICLRQMNSRDKSITDNRNTELSATRIAKRIEKALIGVGDQDGGGKVREK